MPHFSVSHLRHGSAYLLSVPVFFLRRPLRRASTNCSLNGWLVPALGLVWTLNHNDHLWLEIAFNHGAQALWQHNWHLKLKLAVFPNNFFTWDLSESLFPIALRLEGLVMLVWLLSVGFVDEAQNAECRIPGCKLRQSFPVLPATVELGELRHETTGSQGIHFVMGPVMIRTVGIFHSLCLSSAILCILS